MNEIIELLFILIQLIFCLVFLVVSVDFIEDGFIFIAKKLKIPTVYLGFVVISLISSLPEFSIAINSNNVAPILSLGNLLGASTILITLILGIAAIKLKDIHFDNEFKRIDILVIISIILVAAFFLLDKNLLVFESIILILLYILVVFYITRKIYIKNKEVKPVVAAESNIKTTKVLELMLKTTGGLVVLMLSAAILVDVSIDFASHPLIGINPALVGLFVLAFGTNIPELTILLRSKTGAASTLSVGNILGSAAANILLIGVLGIISGNIYLSSTDFFSIVPIVITLILSAICLILFSWSGSTLTRRESKILIYFYFGLILTELLRLVGFF